MGTLISAQAYSKATASESIPTMKACLHINGYTVEQFDTFDWNKGPGSLSAYRVGTNLQQLAEMRDFLKHNPKVQSIYRSSMNKC